jgi:hypothetical protein
MLMLLPTIVALLTGFDVGTTKPINPKSANWQQIDDGNYRTYVLSISHEDELCDVLYTDPYEAAPDCDNCFNGITERGINTCWRRRYDRVSGRSRYYNKCGEDLGLTPGKYPARNYELKLAFWRNTAELAEGTPDGSGVPHAIIPYKKDSINRTPWLSDEQLAVSDPMAAVYPTLYVSPVGGQVVSANSEIDISLFLSEPADTTVVVNISQVDSDVDPLITGFSLGEDGELIVSFSPAYNVDPGTYTFTLRVEISSGMARLPFDVDYVDVEYTYEV